MNQDTLKQLSYNSHLKILNKGINNLSKTPFPHIFIDNFFDYEFADKLLTSFPPNNSDKWERADDPEIEVKMRSKWKSEFDIPENIVDAIRIMNSSLFLLSLSKVLGIPKLIPDPYFTGGGLNVTVSGGLLDVHVDGNYLSLIHI